MKLTHAAWLLTAGMITASFAQAQTQTADDIVNKYMDALGGKEKIKSIRSIYIEGQLDIMGNQASSTTYIINGKGYRNDLDFGGQVITQCITENGGWAINPMAGQTTAQDIPDEQVKASQTQFHIGGPLLDYADRNIKLELQGTEKVGGADDYKLQATTPEGTEFVFFVNPDTWFADKLITRATINGQKVETTIAYSDYEKTEYGFMMARKVEVTVPQGYTITMNQTKIEVNKDIDPRIFDKPE